MPADRLRIDFVAFLRLFPSRLRDPHFWLVQALVGAITLIHFALEVDEGFTEVSSIHHIPVTLYLIPVVYAGIYYGFEGGVLTAVWAFVLTVPSIVVWHMEGVMWLGEFAQVLVSLSVGSVVAWRVELESVHRRHAEATSRRLSLLHDVSAAATQTLQVETVLPGTLGRVADALESDRAWVSVWERPEDIPVLLAEVGEPICEETGENGNPFVWYHLSRDIQRYSSPAVRSNVAVAVPLIAEGNLIGALGVGCRKGRSFSAGDQELLAAMANHIAIALDNARLYRDELRMQKALREYAGQVTRAQEEERKRIARELHDDVVQDLILIRRELNAAGDAASNGRNGEAATVRSLTESLLNKVRRFSRDLRPSVLDDLGLIPAIEWLGADLSKRTRIPVTLEVNGEPVRLPPEREVLVFRVVQEALRNVEKHAHASGVEIGVVFEPAELHVSIADDGKGFKMGQLRTEDYSGKVGLLGMRERANLAGGCLDLASQPGKGTRVAVRVPA